MENRIGFGPRLGAFLLDVLLIAVISVILIVVFGVGGASAGAAAGPEDEMDAAIGAIGGFMGGIMASLIVIYIVGAVWYLLEGLIGATIGKMIVGIKIGKDDGTKAGTGKLLLRYALKNISYLMGILALITGASVINTLGGLAGLVIFIGCFLVLGAKKQAIHDMLAKTAVYKKANLK